METILANKQISRDDISKTARVVENFKNCRIVKEVSKNKISYWDRWYIRVNFSVLTLGIHSSILAWRLSWTEEPRRL